MYNIERQDIEVIDKLTSKLAFWHKKEKKDKLEDEYLQKLSNSKDRINSILRGTIYE